MTEIWRRLATPIGFVLSTLLGVALSAPAVLLLVSEVNVPAGESFIGISVNTETGAADLASRVNEVDPTDDGPVRIFFRFNLNPLSEMNAGAPATILLAGPIASALRDCDDPDFAVTRDLRFDDLSGSEQRTALELVTSSTDDEGDDTSGSGSTSSALASVDDEVYTAIRPGTTYAYPDTWSLAHGSAPAQQFTGVYTYTTCTFDRAPFWSSPGVRQTFAFPSFAATSGRGDGASSVLEASGRLRVVPTAYDSLVRSDVVATPVDSGGQDFLHNDESWNEVRAAVHLRGVTLVFENESAKQERDIWIFIAGVGVSIVGGVVASFLIWLARRPARAPRQSVVP